MKKSLLSIVAVAMLVGCTSKAPEPVKLDDESAIKTVNQGLVEKRISEVPKDPFLKENNWTYQIVAVKKNNNLLENKQIVKTFYVAQNAQEIILMGRADLLNEYLNYFKSNGVTAKFKLQPVTYEDSNLVNMLFFNKIEEVK